MEDLLKHPCVQLRGKVYRFRKKVPSELVSIIGKKEITKSLGTSNLREANLLAHEEQIITEAMFDKARRKLANDPTLIIPTPELKRIAVRWFHDYMIEEEKQLAALNIPSHKMADFLEMTEQEIYQQGVLEDSSSLIIVQKVVNELIEEEGMCIDSSDTSYWELCQYVNRGHVEALKRQKAYILSDYKTSEFDPLFATSASLHAIAPQDIAAKTIPLEELIQQYENDPRRANITPSAVLKTKYTFDILKELLGGDYPITSISRDDCKEVREILQAVPKNKTQRYPKLNHREAAELTKGNDSIDRLAPKSINQHISTLSSLLEYGVNEGFLPSNPARKLTIPDPVHKKDKRNPFTLEQLTSIFLAPLYKGCVNDQLGYNKPGPNKPKRGRFWVPLLALYGGFRATEVCQLLVSDVEKVDGILLIRIQRDEEGKKIKSRAAERMVPVHPVLKSIGFEKYWEQMKKRGNKKLFPEMKKGVNEYYSNRLQHWFGRFLEKQEAKTSLTSFHSFRHNFRDAMREAEISEERTRTLGGWDGGERTDSNYGGGLKASTLYAEICKIEYPGLDLSHLIDN